MMDMFIPSCREAVRLQSRSLDEKLGLADTLRLRFHMLICSTCRRYVAQLRFLRHDVLQSEKLDSSTPGSLSPEAKMRMIATLKKSK